MLASLLTEGRSLEASSERSGERRLPVPANVAGIVGRPHLASRHYDRPPTPCARPRVDGPVRKRSVWFPDPSGD